MSENVKNNNVVHPADALAAALDRASGLLAALMDLYDADRQGFVGGNTFIVHGFSTASELIDEAGRALADLHEKCDLTLLADAAGAGGVAPVPVVPTKAPEVAASRHHPATTAAPHHPAIVAAVATLEEGVKPQAPLAQNYREFLEKVTKAEALASLSPTAGSSVSTEELLPMMKALRKEIQKVPGVA